MENMFSQKLLLRLKNAYSVTVLTGAGISAESGVPTFRGRNGLWNNYPVEELATIDALEKNPILFWQFYRWRRDLLKKIKPNLGHYALVDIENYFEDFTLITQNVDDLHRKAGSEKILELHGNITYNRCTECGHRSRVMAAMPENDVEKCDKCGGLIKPDIVLFGEALNQKVLAKAQELSAVCEVFFSIGTSALVEPAASLPFIAKGNGAYVVEINPEETAISENMDEVIRGEASKVLTHLVMKLDSIR